jgi:hypothetical protein
VNFPSQNHFSLTVKGHFSGEVPFELIWHDDDDVRCLHGSVAGPRTRRDNTGDGVISGNVGVYGTLFGYRRPDPTDHIAPLEGVVIRLTDSTTGVVVAETSTNANGEYAFHNLSHGAQFYVQPTSDGLLFQPRLGLVRYLEVETNTVGNPWGEPKLVTVGGTASFDLLFTAAHTWDSNADRARYDEPNDGVVARSRLDTNFNGNSKSPGFWKYSLARLRDGELASIQMPISTLKLARRLAQNALTASSGCCGGEDIADCLESSNIYQESLAALLLNHYAGYGVYEPYRSVQAFVVRYVLNMPCDGSLGPAVEAELQGMVNKMLAAN